MITTPQMDRTIPASISDNQLVKLVKAAHRHLNEQEQLQFLELAGLPKLNFEKRIFSRLVRLAYYTNPEHRKAMFALLLEKGIDACIMKRNFLSYEQFKRSA
jgi:hypothetical protein